MCVVYLAEYTESWRIHGGALACLDAVLGSVVVFRLAVGAMADLVIPFGLAKAGLFSGCPVVLAIVAAS